MKLVLLKAPLPGIRHWMAHQIGKSLDHSPYSHSAIVFDDGISGSSWADGGVQLRDVQYDPRVWDFYKLPNALEPQVHNWFYCNAGAEYDQCGVLRFGLPLFCESPNKFFCHEAIAASLGWSNAWRYGPGLLLSRCIDQLGSIPCDFGTTN